MPTYSFPINGISWATGKIVVVRVRDGGTGDTVKDVALTEATPQEYFGNGTATTSATTFTAEARECTTADSAGFDASTTIVMPPETYTPPEAVVQGSGGTAELLTTLFRYINLVGDPGSEVATDTGSVTLRDPTGTYGVRIKGTSTVVVPAGTVMARTAAGVYDYGPITDAAPGLLYEWYAEITDPYGGVAHEPFTTYGSRSDSATLTTRALIEATGKVDVNVWADADSDANAASITAQFDRVVAEAQDAARESADDAGALALWPLATTDAQYPALVRAATDFAVARLQQIRPEPVTPPKEPVGVTGERVARAKMEDVWQAIQLRADTAAASLPVAESVTYYPPGCWHGLTTYGPICG